LNNLILRLLDTPQLNEHTLVGASYFPDSPAVETKLRKALGLTDTPETAYVTAVCSAVKSFSWLYCLTSEYLNTWELLIPKETPEINWEALYSRLKDASSGWVGILNSTGLYKAFFLAPSGLEGVAVAAAALAVYNADVRHSNG